MSATPDTTPRGPSPALRHPLAAAPRLGFLGNVVTRNVAAICAADVGALERAR